MNDLYVLTDWNERKKKKKLKFFFVVEIMRKFCRNFAAETQYDKFETLLLPLQETLNWGTKRKPHTP